MPYRSGAQRALLDLDSFLWERQNLIPYALQDPQDMAGSQLSPAKVVLLAVQLAHKAEVSHLRTLISQHRKTLRTEIVLRVILSHLPESLESSQYVQFLQDLVEGDIVEDPNFPVDKSVLDGLSDKEASKKVRKLRLLPLLWPNAPADAPEDPLTLFLIHRSLRIDENTGLITQVPALVTPFLQRSSYLRTWFISTVLPLLRLNYEYHPQDGSNISIAVFERLDDEAGVKLLLSRSNIPETDDTSDGTLGRDLRGLIGPWMYGDNRSKRRKILRKSTFDAQTVPPLDEAPAVNEKYASWEEVFKWITAQATSGWETAVQTIEQWEGPGDVDLGGYEDRNAWLDEDDQQHLEQRYARSALAAAYLIPEASLDALVGVHRILSRTITRLDLERIPTLEVAGGLLSPVSIRGENNIVSPKNAVFLRNGLMDEQNILTKPSKVSLRFLHALLISAFLFTRERTALSVLRAGQVTLRQDESEQKMELARFMAKGPGLSPTKGDDRYWTRIRNEILWMRSWGAEELGEATDGLPGKGIFGQIPKEYMEVEILKGLLSNSRTLPLIYTPNQVADCGFYDLGFALANQIYEKSPERPISKGVLEETVISAAMEAYDNATNPNKTRGGVKRCHDM